MTAAKVFGARPRSTRSWSSILFEHDLFRKPVPTFRDHALRFAHEPDDVLDRVHGFVGYLACAVGAVRQNLINVTGVLHQPLHVRADWTKLGDSKVDQRSLERGELRTAKFLQHIGA